MKKIFVFFMFVFFLSSCSNQRPVHTTVEPKLIKKYASYVYPHNEDFLTYSEQALQLKNVIKYKTIIEVSKPKGEPNSFSKDPIVYVLRRYDLIDNEINDFFKNNIIPELYTHLFLEPNAEFQRNPSGLIYDEYFHADNFRTKDITKFQFNQKFFVKKQGVETAIDQAAVPLILEKTQKKYGCLIKNSAYDWPDSYNSFKMFSEYLSETRIPLNKLNDDRSVWSKYLSSYNKVFNLDSMEIYVDFVYVAYPKNKKNNLYYYLDSRLIISVEVEIEPDIWKRVEVAVDLKKYIPEEPVI